MNHLQVFLSETGKCVKYLIIRLVLILRSLYHEDTSQRLINAWYYEDLFEISIRILHHHDLRLLNPRILVHCVVNCVVAGVDRLEVTMGKRS